MTVTLPSDLSCALASQASVTRKGWTCPAVSILPLTVVATGV